MLVWLADYLAQFVDGFRVFQYLTLRMILSALSAFAFSLLLGPYFIQSLSARRIGETIRDDGPRTHFSKIGTPTMGGIMLLLAVIFATLLWGRLENFYLQVTLAVTLMFGALGLADDILKLDSGNGLKARYKLLWQILFAALIASALYMHASEPAQTQLMTPFFKNLQIDLNWWYVPFAMLVIIGTSNAVNLTDGLDGLAIMPAVMVGAALGAIAYLVGHAGFAEYLYIPHIPGAGELAIFCAGLGGAGLGFLWFNTYPAQIFMGDIGALAIGAALGVIAVIARHELVLLIMGGIFVAETMSVILQVGWFKLTRKRLFKMAPLHHHFELQGWPEPRIIVRFWIITVILVLCGLATLKLR